MGSAFVPVTRMWDRAELAREESDAAYFMELLYLGEMVLKLLVVELLAGMQDDRERHRYSLEYRLVRADGLGEWAEVLDQALTGPASSHLTAEARTSQRELSQTFGPGAETWQREAVDLLVAACTCLDSDFEDLSRVKVSTRNWVRAFTWLRNRTRGHGSPRVATLSSVCPHLEASLRLIAENAPAFGRSWAHLHRNLSGKYRVSSFGGGREVFQYLTKGSEEAFFDGAYVYLDQPRRAYLLFTDPELADFFLPNGNYRKSQFESISYVTDDRRFQDGSAYVLPADAQPPSETAGAPDLGVIGNVFSNIPPRPDGYIQRRELEAELSQVLLDDRHPVVTLQGRGGVGKTSLALDVLHRIAEQGEFFAIIWFSARDIDLLTEGPRVVRADVLSIDDVAADFSRLMEPGSRVGTQEARGIFTSALAGKSPDGPFIVVFDNFETIREQAELYSFVSNAVRLPNKVLITTRTRDFKADYPIEVGGMERDEYRALVREVALKLGIEGIVDESYEEQLYEESNGHPYITKVLLGEVAHAKAPVTVKRIVATKDAVLDALFDRSYASLSPSAQRIFLTLCSWRSMVPRLGLEAVLLRPGNERFDVETALVELVQTSLIEEYSTSDVDSATFLSVPLAAALFGKRKLVTSPLKIMVDADMELVRGFGPANMTDAAHGLGPRLARLMRAVAERGERGSDLTEEIAVVEYIATGYPPAWLSLARLQQELGMGEQAIASLNRYLEAVPNDVEAWRLLIVMYRAANDILGEVNARLHVADISSSSYDELSTAASRLNGLIARGELTVEAEERHVILRKLRAAMEHRQAEANAADFSRLAWLCMNEKDLTAAESYARKGLELEADNEHCLRLLRRLDGRP